MDYKHVEKEDHKGKKVKLLDETYESGIPETIGCGKELGWRGILKTKEEKLKYIKSAERYWYSDDWFGSEKRR
ncbi:MAG: hypothetical protein SVZ03_05510 [Spirochaetota bacterium]|nr:hypothetical protein [Spirochaetota bacterium]